MNKFFSIFTLERDRFYVGKSILYYDNVLHRT